MAAAQAGRHACGRPDHRDHGAAEGGVVDPPVPAWHAEGDAPRGGEQGAGSENCGCDMHVHATVVADLFEIAA